MTTFITKVKEFLESMETLSLHNILDLADNLTEAEILQLAVQIEIKNSIDYVADILKERLEEIRDAIDGK
jgi:Ni,Fe-hydrogenase maturation factor